MSRRRFLRGIGGAVLALPYLESLERKAYAQAAAPKRCVILWQNNGVHLEQFFPTTPFGPLTDASFAPDRGVAPLRDYRDRLLIPRGLDMSPSVGTHGNVAIGLTCSRVDRFNGDFQAAAVNWATAPSFDQILAKAVNPGGARPLNLRVSTRESGNVYSTLSYTAAKTPVTSQRNPLLAYRDLVGLGGAPADNPALRLMVERRKSVLDLVRGRLTALGGRTLADADRKKLDLHLTAVRDLERSMEQAGLQKACELPAARKAELEALQTRALTDAAMFPVVARMHLDVIALALSCDTNRVATMHFGEESGGPTYRFDGLDHTFGHHTLSHGFEEGGLRAGSTVNFKQQLTEIDQWHAKQVKHLLDRLAATSDGAGTLLDGTIVVWMNTFGAGGYDDRGHSSRDLPVVMAGNLRGFFKTGRYLDLRDAGGARKPHNMLLTTLMNGMGVVETHFGSKTDGRPGQLEALKG